MHFRFAATSFCGQILFEIYDFNFIITRPSSASLDEVVFTVVSICLSASFVFTENARLVSVVGEKSIAGMIATLCDALEEEYGVMVARLYRVFRPGKG